MITKYIIYLKIKTINIAFLLNYSKVFLNHKNKDGIQIKKPTSPKPY